MISERFRRVVQNVRGLVATELERRAIQLSGCENQSLAALHDGALQQRAGAALQSDIRVHGLPWLRGSYSRSSNSAAICAYQRRR